MPKFVVIDTVTTGLDKTGNNSIIEIAVATLNEVGLIDSTWATLINPNRDIDLQDIQIINAADILNAPKFEDIAGDLVVILQGRILVGHNIEFDTKMLEYEFSRMGINLHLDMDACLCTMDLAKKYMPEAERNLAACCDRAGVSLNQTHSALYDTLATAQLLQALAKAAGGFNLFVKKHNLEFAAQSITWPNLLPLETACVQRGYRKTKPHYLEKLVNKLPNTPGDASVQGYFALLDRVLVDRILSSIEAQSLIDIAEEHGIGRSKVIELNSRYLEYLVLAASADGVITKEELADLHLVAGILGFPSSVADKAIAKVVSVRTMSPETLLC